MRIYEGNSSKKYEAPNSERNKQEYEQVGDH